MLVCKRWHRTYLSTPAVHALLRLCLPAASYQPEQVEQWLLINCQRLQCVGHFCTSAAVSLVPGTSHGVCLSQLVGMLSSFQPAALRPLTLTLQPTLPAGLASWLGSMSKLTHLSLKCKKLQPSEAAVVGIFSQLQSLHLETGAASRGLLGALLRLRRLTSLELAAKALPTSLVALSGLRQLRVLKVALRRPAGQEPLPLPPPSAFPCLVEYNLNAGSSGNSSAQVSAPLAVQQCCFSRWQRRSAPITCVPSPPWLAGSMHVVTARHGTAQSHTGIQRTTERWRRLSHASSFSPGPR